jgi:Phage terminase large subunit (GpA).
MQRVRTPHGQDQWQSEPGQGIAENPGVTRRGFWLNCFVSPFIRWEVVFAEFREAVHRKEDGDESLFRVVVATRLAENFVEHIERMSEPEVLLSRRENYSCEVPDQAKVIVAAIDTQVSWFEYLVVAGGARGEICCLETGTIEGRIETDAKAMYHLTGDCFNVVGPGPMAVTWRSAAHSKIVAVMRQRRFTNSANNTHGFSPPTGATPI